LHAVVNVRTDSLELEQLRFHFDDCTVRRERNGVVRLLEAVEPDPDFAQEHRHCLPW
jgi:hypothetical protein